MRNPLFAMDLEDSHNLILLAATDSIQSLRHNHRLDLPFGAKRGDRNVFQHLSKHDEMDRQQDIPIEKPGKAAGFKLRDLSEDSGGSVQLGSNLEPRTPWEPHLRKQPQ